MAKNIYRYSFMQQVPVEEIETTILLAILAVESLHGESQTRLEASHHFDSTKRALVIDATTPVGRDFNRLFIGFTRREFGEDSFQVVQMDLPTPPLAAR